MGEDPGRVADERLAEALERADVADPRDEFRGWLRSLKSADPVGFRQMTVHFESEVRPRLLEAPDPLREWLEFGIALAGTSGPGQAVLVDRTGRSKAWRKEVPRGELLLWLPDDRQAAAMTVAVPRSPSPAQAATIDLLVLRKLRL